MDCVSDISNLRNLLISGLLLLLRIWSVAFHGVFVYWFLSHPCRSNPLSTKVDSQAEAGLDPCSSGSLLLYAVELRKPLVGPFRLIILERPKLSHTIVPTLLAYIR